MHYTHRHGRVHLPHLFDAKDLNPLGRYRVPVCGISGLLSLSLFFLTLHRTKLAKYNAAIMREKQFRHHKATVAVLSGVFTDTLLLVSLISYERSSGSLC